MLGLTKSSHFRFSGSSIPGFNGDWQMTPVDCGSEGAMGRKLGHCCRFFVVDIGGESVREQYKIKRWLSVIQNNACLCETPCCTLKPNGHGCHPTTINWII